MRLPKISLMLIVSGSLVASALCSGCSREREKVYEGSVYSWKENGDTVYGVAFYEDDVLYFMSDYGVVREGDLVLNSEVIDSFAPRYDDWYFPSWRNIEYEESDVYDYLSYTYDLFSTDVYAEHRGDFSNPIEMMRLSGR